MRRGIMLVAALALAGAGFGAGASDNNAGGHCTAVGVVDTTGYARAACAFTFSGNPLTLLMDGTGLAYSYQAWVSQTGSLSSTLNGSAVYSRSPNAGYVYCTTVCLVPIYDQGSINNYSTKVYNHANTTKVAVGSTLYCHVWMHGIVGSTIEANCTAGVAPTG